MAGGAQSKTKLTNLDTKGVAVVTAGANGKRFAMAKGADATFEDLLMSVIKSGDAQLDEKAIEDLCMAAGLDAQATETFKAIMKLRYVYRDNAAFNGLLKQQVNGQPGDGTQPQPGAQPGMPGSQTGAQQPPKAQQPGQAGAPDGKPDPGAAPHDGPAAPTPPQQGAPDKPNPFAGKDKGAGDQEPSPGEKQKDAQGAEPGEGTPGEEQNDKGQPPASGDGKKEPPMALTDEEKKKLEKADEAVKKAAAAETEIVELKKSNDAMKAAIEMQKTAVEASTQAVQKMRDDLALSQWVSKAKDELAYLPGKTPDELGKMLFDVEKLSPDMAKSQFEMLKAQNAVMKSSGMFRPSGAAGGAPGAGKSAWEEALERARDIITKSVADGVTKEVAEAKAISAVFKSDAALYKRYCEEQTETNRRSFN